jgi:PAS domain S-box-containing protein
VTTERLTLTGPRGELALLFLASCAVVLVLLLAIASGGEGLWQSAQARAVILVGVVLAIGAGAFALLGTPLMAGTARDADAAAEIARLNADLRTARAVVEAEHQTVVFWDRGQAPKVMSHRLTGVAGFPDRAEMVTRPGLWLDPASAADLQAALQKLVDGGQPFTLLLTTIAGAPLEADGRAAGGRAVLRLRDVAGFKRDVARLLDQHRVLRREATAIRALIDAVPMPVWLTGADGRITWANAAYLSAAGVTTRADVEHASVDLLDSRQRARAAAATSEGRLYRERLPLIVGGEMKAHDVTIVPSEGLVAGMAHDAAVLEDVKGAIARQTAAFDRTLHRVSTGVAIYGRDQRLTFFNDAYAKIWELDTDWLARHPSIDETLERLRALKRLPAVSSFRDWKAKVMTGFKADTPYEDWWHLTNGKTIHVTAELRPDGGATYLFDDVTERFAQQSRMEEMLEARTETLNNLREGVAVFRPDGLLDLFNPAFASIWGLTHERLKERPHIEEIVQQCRALHDRDEDWAALTRAVTAFSERRAVRTGTMDRKDGSVVEYTIAPLPDGGTLVTYADITDRRRSEQLLIERNQALAQADVDKTQLLGHVSYEFRTPLATIAGYAELLESGMGGALSERQRSYVADIRASAKTLEALIDDVLDLQAIDAGGLELKIAPSAVRPIVEAAVKSVRERAKRGSVGIEIAIAADVGTVVADASRVRHVLYHLLSNAIGFSAAGERVRISAERQGGMIAFAVEDRGVGVPAEQQARLFDRFESRPRGSRHRGAGNGLAIVKSLVELHGGDVTFVSEPGHGTRVTVRFPEDGLSA